MGTFLLDLALQSTLLLAGTFIVVGCVRSPAARHLLLLTALAALSLLPLLPLVLPAWRILPAPASHANIPAPASPIARPTRAVLPLPSPPSLPAAPIHSTLSLPLALAALYFAGVALALARLALSALALRRLQRRAAPLTSVPWPDLLADLAASFDLRRPITLLRSTSPGMMPMTWSSRRPRLLLPADACAWSSATRRAVLLHELAHIRRQDSLTQFVARLICALCWYQPLVWIALGHLRHEAERACDELVLGAGERPSSYADTLLHIADGRPRNLRFTELHAIAMAGASRSQLHRRIRAILDPTRPRSAFSPRRALLLSSLLALLTLPLAALRLEAAAPSSAATQPAGAFPHAVPFSLGTSDFLPGDRITITAIRGTADTFALKNTYEITGTYSLASADRAILAAFVTSMPDADPKHHDPIDPHQTVTIAKGTGQFTLILPLLSPGHPHLSFYPADGGESFSALYFGAGAFLDATPATAPAPTFAPGDQMTITVHDGKVRVESGGRVIEADKITWLSTPASQGPATRPSH